MSYIERQKTMELIRQGIKEQAEELAKKQEENRQGENITSFSNTEKTLTQDEKIELLTKAVAELTIKVNGGNTNGEGE